MLKTRTIIDGVQRAVSGRVGIVGACFEKGQSQDGTQHGPAVFREAEIASHLNQLGYDVKDYGDIRMEGTNSPPQEKSRDFACKHAKIIAEANGQLSRRVIDCLREERTCLAIGGDHSMGE